MPITEHHHGQRFVPEKPERASTHGKNHDLFNPSRTYQKRSLRKLPQFQGIDCLCQEKLAEPADNVKRFAKDC